MKKPLIIVVFVLVILFATCRLWPRARRATSEMVDRPRVCEACGRRFDGPTAPIVLTCPECGKRAAVRVHHYVCRACGARLEAFWERPADPSLERPDPLRPPEMAYKRPGGTWGPSIKGLGSFKCPKCGSTSVGPPRPM